ncbi:hypothetical protein PIIN_03522 [Serendipita indica DSM 11827]|uniref:Uncharacterized protein n=1 Tax=Serendipita indica (strain DSM 11827) TaxID=1109443 RepID=G4TE31_SERID|nr:hypothetical protein PIIN_03522 [Serendipita indica DSM 11827]
MPIDAATNGPKQQLNLYRLYATVTRKERLGFGNGDSKLICASDWTRRITPSQWYTYAKPLKKELTSLRTTTSVTSTHHA